MGKVSSADSANALARVSQESADGSLTFLAWIHSFLRQEVLPSALLDGLEPGDYPPRPRVHDLITRADRVG